MLRAALVAALVLVGCGEGTSISPSSTPTPAPTPVPVAGPIVVGYKRPAGMTCRSAGTEFEDAWCNRASVKVTSESWPSGYGFIGLKMEPQDGGGFSAEEMALSAPKLGLTVYDPWRCPPGFGCGGIRSGIGLSVNGTKLKDESEVTYFGLVYPTVYP